MPYKTMTLLFVYLLFTFSISTCNAATAKITRIGSNANICDSMKSSYEKAIKSCGLAQWCIADQLSAYKWDISSINHYGYTSVKAANAVGSGKGTSLVQLDLFRGCRHQRLIETWLVNTTNLQRVLSIPPGPKNYLKNEVGDRDINATPFRVLLNRSTKISNYEAYMFKKADADIVLVPYCKTASHYGGDVECIKLKKLTILRINASGATKLCELKIRNTREIMSDLVKVFTHGTPGETRADTLKKINSQPGQEKVKFKCNLDGTHDKNETVRAIAVENIQGRLDQFITALIKVAALDKSEEIRTAAATRIKSRLTSNDVDNCDGVPVLERNLDLALKALKKRGATQAFIEIFGAGYSGTTTVPCCMSKKSQKKIRLSLEKLKNEEAGFGFDYLIDKALQNNKCGP